MKTFSEKDGYDRFVSTSKAAGEPWNKEINFHFECVEGDGFPENQEIFIFHQKDSFGVGFEFLKNSLKIYIQGVSGVRNHVVQKFLKNNHF